MPMRYDVDVENGVVFIFYWGVKVIDDDRDLLTAVRQDPRVQPHFRTLADYTQVTGVEGSGSYDHFAKLAESYRSIAGGPRTARVAIYVPERNVVYGALRQFQIMVGDETRLRIWVGLPPDAPRPRFQGP
jgi:hypothetical protein